MFGKTNSKINIFNTFLKIVVVAVLGGRWIPKKLGSEREPILPI